MDEQKKPRTREKRVSTEGKGVKKYGEGLGTGPVNNTGNYSDREQQEKERAEAQRRQPANPFASFLNQADGSHPGQQRPGNGGNPFYGQQHAQGNGNPFRDQGQQGSGTRPQSAQNRPQSASQNPFGTAARPSGGPQQRQYHSAVRQNSGSQQRPGGTGGGGGKLILIVIVLALLFGGGSLSGLFGGGGGQTPVSSGLPAGGNGNSGLSSLIGSFLDTGETPSSQGQTGSGSGAGSWAGLFGGTQPSTEQSAPAAGAGLGNLLNTFLGSSGNSSYDLTGIFGGGSGSSPQYFTSSSQENTPSVDETVSRQARKKYTTIKGKNKDTVTILVYMCGTDLESQQGMATSDLKEMVNATLSDNINLIIYTGGCTRWKNNVVSSRVNQIYQIRDGGLYCLEDNMGTGNMTSPETLSAFIRYGSEHFPANRMCLIFWDHGGGSVSGFGYDEKYGHNQSMSLAGINTALKAGGVKFDFIGFDACLMATVENGIMLSQYADYMIASEETEPGVGWYYTNWLTRLAKNSSMPTVQIGKLIADDFVEVCNQKCRGQATTLSVVDLAELQETVPEELKKFSIDTNELIQNKEFKTVSSARGKTREFAQHSRIDQIDLVHFAKNMGTAEGRSLAKTIQGAVKYNRTGGGMSNAYGLSIYFPYKRAGKVSQMVSTYKAIGMDEEYTRCIQEFASLEVCGQVSAGTPLSYFGGSGTAAPGLMDSLLGQNSHTNSYTSSGLTEMLGGLFSGGSGGPTGSMLDLFIGRSMTTEKAVEYILENHFDPSQLVWMNGRITLSRQQWNMVDSLVKNVYYDDGTGFIDLGTDPEFTLEGDSLVSSFDGTWLSIKGQPVAYYYLGTVEDGEAYVISGYVPAILNGERVNLILNFDNERPYGYIAGADKVYTDGESDTQAKMLIDIGKGDRIQFICDYYDYDRTYRDSYKLGREMILGSETVIENTTIGNRERCRVTYCFTDIYQQRYWTPPAP